jgi:RNA-directed DNA polymerase
METWSVHTIYEKAKVIHSNENAIDLQRYAIRLKESGLPVIFSLNHLSHITGIEYRFLHDTVARKREPSNYRMFAIRKRSGGRRFIHAVSGKLLIVQQFINSAILQRKKPHPCSYAFHPDGGIKKCAAQHCGARWLFQYDLDSFFYNVNEIDVYHVFRKLGYKKLLSFELSHLCTTTQLPIQAKTYIPPSEYIDWNETRIPYKNKFFGVLPQGAPTSPMLSNLVAEELDVKLYNFALKNGFVYTRYADDITISSMELMNNVSLKSIHNLIISIIRKCGFKENKKKIRIARPGSKKIVLGLLVDGEKPRISKETYHRIERHLYAIKKFGLENAAAHEGFDSAYGYYNHISGLISYVNDVDKKQWQELYGIFVKIKHPLS